MQEEIKYTTIFDRGVNLYTPDNFENFLNDYLIKAENALDAKEGEIVELPIGKNYPSLKQSCSLIKSNGIVYKREQIASSSAIGITEEMNCYSFEDSNGFTFVEDRRSVVGDEVKSSTTYGFAINPDGQVFNIKQCVAKNVVANVENIFKTAEKEVVAPIDAQVQ